MPRRHSLEPHQLDCLSSPVRAELLELLTRAGRASAAELAADMLRTPHSLYHHLRALEEAGLIRRESELQVTGGRGSAVYVPVSRRFAMPRDIDQRSGESVVRATRAMLRKANREHEASWRVALAEPAHARWIRPLRVRARLTEADARELTERLRELGEWLRERDGDAGRLYALSALFTSVVEKE